MIPCKNSSTISRIEILGDKANGVCWEGLKIWPSGWARLRAPWCAKERVMDSIKILARNLFYKTMASFKKAYDNNRDDHEYFRRFTHAPGTRVETTKSITLLEPAPYLPPKNRTLLGDVFLDRATKWADHFTGWIPEKKFALKLRPEQRESILRSRRQNMGVFKRVFWICVLTRGLDFVWSVPLKCTLF